MPHERKGLIELGWFDNPTLLETLCHVNGQSGGTIHAFLGDQDYVAFENAFMDCVKRGITFPGRASVDKLATQYHLTIQWKRPS
jgi:hypothetical protein